MPSSRQAELLAADRYAASFGIDLVTAGHDRVAVAMAIRPEHLDGEGRLRSGAVFTLADCAMSLISNATTKAFAVSAHLVVTGSAAPGQTMTATAVPAHSGPGRVTWNVRVAVGAQPVATFIGTTLEVPG